MILKRLILVLLAAFLVMGCVGAVSADGEPDITNFEATPNSGYAPLEVTFTFSATNTTTFSIDYGDGSSPDTFEASGSTTHIYSTAESYDATLTATNSTSDTTDTSIIPITVNAAIPLHAEFTASPTSGTYPLTVAFTDTSEGYQIANWSWEFGDGDTSSQQNPSHIFTSNGTYIVNLTVTNSTEASDKYSYPITVSSPTIISSVDITKLTAPIYGAKPDTNVDVSAGVEIYSIEWSPDSTTFAEATTYIVTIILENAEGYVFTTVPTVFLNDDKMSSSNLSLNSANTQLTLTYTFPKTAAKILPGASLSTNISSGTVPLTVKFDYTLSSFDNCTLIYGDGYSSHLTSSSGIITHTYTTAGSYTASLVAKNVNGTTYSNQSITVNKVGLDASFTASSDSGIAPLTVLFVDTSAGSPTQWVWDFGGLGSSATKNPSYTFTTAGTYIVKLTVIDSTGATDSYSRAIYVNTPVSTSTPTPTQTTALTTSVTTFSLGELSIPGPLDVIKEFMHLFYSIFDPVNYVMTINES
mgnify:CR=1 FL=1